MEPDLEDCIRQHAYFLWLDNGRTGDPTYFWLTAEREVLAEVALQSEQALDELTAVGETSTASASQPTRRVNALVLLDSGASRKKESGPRREMADRSSAAG